MTSENVIAWLLILAPLIAGALIYFSKSAAAVAKVGRLDAWLVAKYEAARDQDGGFSRFVTRPLLWALTRVLAWTEPMPDAYLRSTARVIAYGYITGLMVYVAAVVTVAALMIFIAFWVLGQFLESGSNSGGTAYARAAEREDDNLPVARRAGTFYQGGSWLTQERTGRIDAEGYIYGGGSTLTEEVVGRVDKNGRIYKGSNFLTEDLIGRIDEDGTIYRGTNALNEEKIGRIDDDGHVYSSVSWFTEKRVGQLE